MKRFPGLFLFTFFLSAALSAQTWREQIVNPDINYNDIRDNFYREFPEKQATPLAKILHTRKHDLDGKMRPAGLREEYHAPPGYNLYKRWEYSRAPQVYPSGDLHLFYSSYARFIEYLDENPVARAMYEGNLSGDHPEGSGWTQVGPVADSIGTVAGRCNMVAIHPANTNLWYAGSAAGGLWRSTNAGDTWFTTYDFEATLGLIDIAFHPLDADTMYLATGDGDFGDTPTMGVRKSTDAGNTWTDTGLWFPFTDGKLLHRLIIHPTNPNILLASGAGGIWRTTDGAANWTQVLVEDIKDMEFKPGDPNIVYAGCQKGYRSTDAGASWTEILPASGFPTYGTVQRMSLAVTAANPAYVYALCNDWSTTGFFGLYRSTDSGISWNTMSTTPNILGWDSLSAGGQSWYDLTIQASPTNAEEIHTGGVWIHRSTNGGITWTQVQAGCHADIHDLEYLPGSDSVMVVACDGGIYHSTNHGVNWKFRSDNICISQMYKIGLSSSQPYLLLSGHQDNGTNRYNGTNWPMVIGGDGMDCFIDRTNDNIMFGSYQVGGLLRSFDGGASWGGATGGLTGSANWVTPWTQDPTNMNMLYTAYDEIFRSTDYGGSWTQISTIGGGVSWEEIEVAPSDNNYIYAGRYYEIFRSSDGGGAWTNIGAGTPAGSQWLGNFTIDDNNPQHVWVSFTGYSAGNKVFESTNAGATWTNISAGLPNLSARCLAHVPGSSNDQIYCGMDQGIYYKTSALSSWQPYFASLPNVPIAELEIFTPTNKVRASTYGRGVWEADLVTAVLSPPVAGFTADKREICPGDTVQFADLSVLAPFSWTWYFPGGTPSTSTLTDPAVVYNTPGTYPVSLVVSNFVGSDSTCHTVYINVAGQLPLPIAEDFEGSAYPPPYWSRVDGKNDNVMWQRSGGAGSASSASTYFDNYYNDVGGSFDVLLTPPADFSFVTSAWFAFDHAYARYPGYADSLEVVVTTDCGDTWTQLWKIGGDDLSTAPDTTAYFVPGSTQWVRDSVNLDAYAGMSWLQVGLVNRGHYGNVSWVDKINLYADGMVRTTTPTTPVWTVSPNPTEGLLYMQVTGFSGPVTAEIMDETGRTVWSGKGTGSLQADLHGRAAGVYVVRMSAGEWTKVERVVLR